MLPDDLAQQLQALGGATTPNQRLKRACVYNEYAMATPEFEGDDELFRLGRADLKWILENKSLSPRHPIRLYASKMLAYEPPFRRRANRLLIPRPLWVDLQKDLGGQLEGFLDEDEASLTNTEYGQISELVVITYLLNGNLFPYLASWREEANILSADNHDVYTLHNAGEDRVKKTPVSIKFRELPPANDLVVVLCVGRMTLSVARIIPGYRDESWVKENSKEAHIRATRVAADIMVCHTIGEELSEEDQLFMDKLTNKFERPIRAFAARSSIPDYAANARLLNKLIQRPPT
nr:Unknown Function [uncultured bacterium]AIA16791.1 Unknown Function [uncultured bacterium]